MKATAMLSGAGVQSGVQEIPGSGGGEKGGNIKKEVWFRLFGEGSRYLARR